MCAEMKIVCECYFSLLDIVVMFQWNVFRVQAEQLLVDFVRSLQDHFSNIFLRGTEFSPMTLTFKLDLHGVKVNHCAKYLGQRSFSSKVISQTHTGNRWHQLDH